MPSPWYRWDYLRITDDGSNTVGTYCGNQTGRSVRVVGTVAVLTFHTDGSAQSRGFELSFSFLPISPGELSTHLFCNGVFLLFYSECSHWFCINSPNRSRQECSPCI